MSDYKAEFVEFAIASNVLCFGEYKTKAGRMSPYFFNAGQAVAGEETERAASARLAAAAEPVGRAGAVGHVR
ncbi:MAG TPA: hypothetical protein VF501_04295, partial [Thiobacillus sp.]